MSWFVDLVICASLPAAVSAAVKAVDMGLKPVVVSPERHAGGQKAGCAAGVARRISEAYAADGRGIFAMHANTVPGREKIQVGICNI